jgi:hypothetical protein
MPAVVIAYDASRESLFHPELRLSLLGRAVCAESSRLAYMRFGDPCSPQQWVALSQALGSVGITELACFSDDASNAEAFAAVLSAGTGTLVAFRGTDPDEATHLATDLDAVLQQWRQGGRVPAGFAHAFARIRYAIESCMQQHPKGLGLLVVTGHSLEAALAPLAAVAWRADRLITFGSPRVGDDAFVALLVNVHINRYVDCCDIVSQVPPRLPGQFADASPCLYIDSTGQLTSRWSDAQIEADRTLARARYLVEHAWAAATSSHAIWPITRPSTTCEPLWSS